MLGADIACSKQLDCGSIISTPPCVAGLQGSLVSCDIRHLQSIESRHGYAATLRQYHGRYDDCIVLAYLAGLRIYHNSGVLSKSIDRYLRSLRTAVTSISVLHLVQSPLDNLDCCSCKIAVGRPLSCILSSLPDWLRRPFACIHDT